MPDRVNGLDRVRAIAAISVVLAHVVGPSLPEPIRYLFTGHPAVVAFFVVSGFCIHYPNVTGRLDVKAFLAGRFIRIGIPLTAALLIAKYLSATHATLQSFTVVGGYIVWSVVCEIIYYTLYPSLKKLSESVGWRWMIVASLIISYAVAVGLGSESGGAHVYGPQLNWLVSLPAWLIGCFLAERVAFGAKPVSAVWPLRAATALTAAVAYWLTTKTPVGFYLTMMPFAFLVYYWVGAEIESRQHTAVLDWIGQWSYSIYLMHMPAVYLLKDAMPKPLVLLLILPVCFAFYLVVERPSHRLAVSVRNALKRRSIASRSKAENAHPF